MPLQQTFDHGLGAKIPGQSLTMAPGSMPMEKPPQYTNPRQAAEYFWQKLHDPKQIAKLIVLLKNDVPAEYIARTMLFTAVAHGIIHINTMLIMARVLVKQIAAIGILKGIKVKVGNPSNDVSNFLGQFPNKDYDSPDVQPKSTVADSSPIKSGILAGAQ